MSDSSISDSAFYLLCLRLCYETGITVRAVTAFTKLVIRLVSLGLLRFGIEKLYQVADAQNLEWLQKENPVQNGHAFQQRKLLRRTANFYVKLHHFAGIRRNPARHVSLRFNSK